jgi:hypothetical protein
MFSLEVVTNGDWYINTKRIIDEIMSSTEESHVHSDCYALEKKNVYNTSIKWI